MGDRPRLTPYAPRIIAHRGSSAFATENTLAAFERACAQGADAIELDVQLSADGVPVVFHDTTLRRLTGQRGAVITRSAEALGHLRVHPRGRPAWDEPIPTLRQVLRRFAGRVGLLIELKVARAETRREPLARAVIDLVCDLGDVDSTWLIGFDRPTMLTVRRLSPAALPCAFSLPRLPSAAPLARALAPFQGLVCPARCVRADRVATRHAAGQRVFAYRCDTPRMATRAARAGVDGLMADDPLGLRERVTRLDGSP